MRKKGRMALKSYERECYGNALEMLLQIYESILLDLPIVFLCFSVNCPAIRIDYERDL